MIGRTITAVLLAGWLADRLARHDADVEAGIDAYEAGQHDDALAAFDRAVARLGERPELSFDRGLALLAKGDTDAAKTAFERASEADSVDVRASAFYELGNLALNAEAYDDAIARYIDCLQARPDHENAKWNLEIALQRKRKDEEKQDEEKQDEENDGSDDSGGSDAGGSDDSGGSDAGGSDDSGGSDSGGGVDSGGSDSSGGDSGQQQDDQKQDDQKQDDQKQDDQKQDDQKQDDQKQDDQKQADQKQDDQKQEQPAAPTPVERADLQRALDQLDEQDGYLLDRPRGRTNGPIKDW